MDECRLSARIEEQNDRHGFIGVFQNGGKAGVLVVDAEHASVLTEYLNGYPTGTDPQAILAASDIDLLEEDRSVRGYTCNCRICLAARTSVSLPTDVTELAHLLTVSELQRVAALLAAADKVCELQDKLLVCYRVNRNPGAVLDKLRRARDAYQALKDEQDAK